MDIYSRKIVGWRVHECESMEYSARLVEEICLREGILENQVILHSDNGGAMKGATMLATLQRLGIFPSFSRPSVSDDNPYSESLFKTLKYCPQYPSKPFSSTDAANGWVEEFVHWYNEVNLHSGIKFVTPSSRHAEAFFKTFKGEFFYRRKFNSERELRSGIFEYIEIWYNRKRLHSSLGYMSPVEYEDKTNTAA